MDIPPVGFGETGELPGDPVGDPAGRLDIEDEPGDRHDDESEQGEKRS